MVLPAPAMSTGPTPGLRHRLRLGMTTATVSTRQRRGGWRPSRSGGDDEGARPSCRWSSAPTPIRSHFIIDDAKAHFARSGGKYDVIISEPPNPWVSGPQCCSREFYQRVRGQLHDRGLLGSGSVYEFDIELLARS
jgi:hypothetical protein